MNLNLLGTKFDNNRQEIRDGANNSGENLCELLFDEKEIIQEEPTIYYTDDDLDTISVRNIDKENNIDYIETVDEAGKTSFSTGSYGKNKTEAINNLKELYKSSGHLDVRVYGDKVGYVEDDNFIYLVINEDGSSNTCGWSKIKNGFPVADEGAQNAINDLQVKSIPIFLTCARYTQASNSGVKTIALSTISKTNEIINNLGAEFEKFGAKIAALSKKNLSEAEMERETKKIEKEMQKKADEAFDRIEILKNIAFSIQKISYLNIKTGNNGAGAMDLNSFILSTIENVDKGSSGEFQNNGGDTQEKEVQKYEIQQEEILEKIKKNNEKLTNGEINQEKAKKMETENKVLTFEFELLSDIIKILDPDASI